MKIGPIFGEQIRTEKIRKWKVRGGDGNFLKPRGILVPVILLIAGIFLFLKLFSLQVVRGQEFRDLSDSNRIRTRIVNAPRGIIFDRNGEELVQNVPGFRQIHDCGKDCKKAVVLSRDQALAFLAKGAEDIEVDSLREYKYKDATAHILGYVGQISKEELNTVEFGNYNGTDFVGKGGIERYYEDILRGFDGKELIEVDATGQKVRSLGATDPIPGNDIKLTLDASLQQAVYDATKDVKKGAVVVSTPDGQILAMVSRPSYDPNLFTLDNTYERASDSAYKNVEAILTDDIGQPVLNRVIGGAYPPGSTFKIITSAAGLQENVIDERYTVEDTGVLKIGDFSYANWYYTNYGRTEPGKLNVIRGLSRSNDIFFYKLAEKVGVDKLSRFAEKWGLGAKTGIDLPGEVTGIVPDPDWKEEVIGGSWYLGDTFIFGIGQGFLLTTPLQVNSFTEIVANGGTLYQPRFLRNQKSKIKNQNLLSEENRELIRQGMIDSCSSGVGVAWPLFNFSIKSKALQGKIDGKNYFEVKTGSDSAALKDQVGVSIACKTGTAQHGGDETLPHAWITLFAPAYDPEIVITVLNEESGEGSNEAAPIAKKILEAWFGEKYLTPQDKLIY